MNNTGKVYGITDHLCSPLTSVAGSYALLGATVLREATVVTRLREAGAIILGKATMGQWAQCRSRKASSSHGWSAYGGQVHGAYYPQQDPSGSSSGSAVAVSVGLAMGSVATETSGSIVLPGERSNIVGIKPTLGLTSRSMTIPISIRQDTTGPMARTVKDAAHLLTAFAGPDKHDNWTSSIPFTTMPDYAKACNYSALKGARLGIPRNGIDHFLDDTTGPILESFRSAVKLVSNAGAKVVDHADFAKFDFAAFARTSSIVLDTDFVAGLKDYLSHLDRNPNNIRDLFDLAHFTKADPREEYPGRDTYVWDRQLTRNITNHSARSHAAYQANLRMAGEDGVLGVLDRYHLDALVLPTFASYQLPAIGGLPVVTVPLGFYPSNTPTKMNAKGNLVSVAPNIPYGIAFIGRKWSEERLIGLAYAFEQRTLVRRRLKPHILPTFELKDLETAVGGLSGQHRTPLSQQPVQMAAAALPPAANISTGKGQSRTNKWSFLFGSRLSIS